MLFSLVFNMLFGFVPSSIDVLGIFGFLVICILTCLRIFSYSFSLIIFTGFCTYSHPLIKI